MSRNRDDGKQNSYHRSGSSDVNQSSSDPQSVANRLREFKEASFTKEHEQFHQQMPSSNLNNDFQPRSSSGFSQPLSHLRNSGNAADPFHPPFGPPPGFNQAAPPPPGFNPAAPPPPGFNPATQPPPVFNPGAPPPQYYPFSGSSSNAGGFAPGNYHPYPPPSNNVGNFPPQSSIGNAPNSDQQSLKNEQRDSGLMQNPYPHGPSSFSVPNVPALNSFRKPFMSNFGSQGALPSRFESSMGFQQGSTAYDAQSQWPSPLQRHPQPGTFTASAQTFSAHTPFATSAFGSTDSGFGGVGRSKDAEAIADHKIGAQENVDQWLKLIGKSKETSAATDSMKSKLNVNEKLEASADQPKSSNHELETEKTSKNMSIPTAQRSLKELLDALAAVHGELQDMEEDAETADHEIWQDKVKRLQQLKEAYMKTKQEVNLTQVHNLKRRIELRRKKRERQKRQKQEKNEMEQQILYERAEKHAAIDLWRSKIQQEYLDQQQTKRMKEIADKTLGKVRREIREARKLVDTINKLQKLRDIRSDTAEKRGQIFPPSSAEHFRDKSGDMLHLLQQQIDNCEKEEAALKLILETEKEQAKDKEREEMMRKKKEEEETERVEDSHSLFGPPVVYYPGHPLQPFANFYQQSQYSLHALQHIRREWDMFLVPEGTPMASRIPDGWVVPEAPSSSAWASAFKSESS